MIRIYLLSLLILGITYTANAQSQNSDDTMLWFTGEVELTDGSLIAGKLSYNFITSILSVEQGNQSIGYTAGKVIWFSLEEAGLNGEELVFYSLPPNSNSQQYHFYQKRYEKNGTALLSRNVFDFNVPETTITYILTPNGALVPVPTQTLDKEVIIEELYLIKQDKELQLIAQRVKDKEPLFHPSYQPTFSKGNLDAAAAQNTALGQSNRKYKSDKAAIAEFLAIKKSTLMKICDTNNLDLRSQEDIVKLLEFIIK